MRRCGWILLLSLVFVVPVLTQETRGNISGTVRDAQGVVPGATVDDHEYRYRGGTAARDQQQRLFRSAAAPAGELSDCGDDDGLQEPAPSGILVAVGQQVSVQLTLELGAITEEITVTAASPLLDTSAVSSGQNFDSRMVEGLPMFSNMPIMLTRFAAGVNPSTNQSLVSQGFADGTTQAAGAAFGGVGSNTYSIDGATNSGSARRIAASPNSDMIQEMRVESSNFDASVGHGTGLQIAMVTRSGANQYRGTANYQYWTNKINELNPSQRLTFTPAGKDLYETGRSHNLALTAGGPVVIPKLVDGRNKLFFFANYSHVNDFIPGKNQASSTVPASDAELRGDFSDLLRLPNPAQYQIYDPLTVRRDPANPNRFIRDPFPNNIIPASRIVNPLYGLYRQMVPKPNQNLIEDGATPTGNYYRGGEPDKPVSTLYAGRIDFNKSARNRFFFRVSGNTFLEPVSDWTYEVPEFEGLHSIDRSRYNWAVIGNWTHVRGKTVIDSQVASNRFFQDDLLRRLHEYKPTDIGMPSYLDSFCAAQNDCMLPAVAIGGYQGISQGAVSGDRTTNLQGTVNVTQVRGAHTLRGGVDARLAQRQRGLGGNPSSQLSFTNEFTRQASDTAQLTPSNLGLSLAAFMLGIPSTSTATIQPTSNLRNHFFAVHGQDSWRFQNLTLNLGLRVEWENGISGGQRRADRRFRSECEAGHLRSRRGGLRPEPDSAGPCRGLPRSRRVDLRDRSGPGRESLASTDHGDAARLGGLQSRGEDGDQRRLRPLLRHAQRRRLRAEQRWIQRHDQQHEQHGLRPDVPARQPLHRAARVCRSVPRPGRWHTLRRSDRRHPRGQHHRGQLQLLHPEPGPRARASTALAHRRAAGAREEPVGGSGVRRFLLGPRRGRHQVGLPAAAVLDSRQPQRPRHRRPGGADGQRHESVHAVELCLASRNGSRALPAHGRQRLLHGDDHAAPAAAAPLLAHQQPRVRQPAAARGQGAFAAAQRQPALRGRVHRERRDVVQQQPYEPHRRGIRP